MDSIFRTDPKSRLSGNGENYRKIELYEKEINNTQNYNVFEEGDSFDSIGDEFCGFDAENTEKTTYNPNKIDVQEEENSRKMYFQNLLDKRKFDAFEEYMLNCNVIFATMIGSAPNGSMKFFRPAELNEYSRKIDVSIVDEVSQALEVPSFIPILQGERCILAGDIHQLPPTITVDRKLFGDDSLHLLDRVDRCFGDIFTKRLSIQYRMNENIAKWSCGRFYDGLLIPSDSVRSIKLDKKPDFNDFNPYLLEKQIVFANTDSESGLYCEKFVNTSYQNFGEAFFISSVVEYLISGKICREKDIGVISPYSAQIELIRSLLAKYKNIEVKSIDGYQGREKQVILLSFVRTGDNIGFLRDARRLNVAVTRAKRFLMMVGSEKTMGDERHFRELFSCVDELGRFGEVSRFFKECSILVKIFDEIVGKREVSFGINIDCKLHGRCIGKGGANVKEIKNKFSGVGIEFLKGKNVVNLSGVLKEVLEVEKRLYSAF